MDTPQVIAGRFRVECEIGRGGMGTVYRASHLGLERVVAVKVLKPEFSADREVAERFMREARTMARLRHPRAAMIFDAGHLSDGRPFIVMEYVEGSTLAETLARDGQFAPERAVGVAAEICDVLAEAHALGIIHRDLKPSNIMLNGRGVCVLDFGIAKVLQTSTEVTRTHATTETGLVIGTPRYMSPEQCLGHQIGPASDLYSVGVLLYEMLTGRPPFVDQLSSAVLVKQATAAPPPLSALQPECPPALAAAVHSLLSKNPAQRPASAVEARRLLEEGVARRPRAAEAAGAAPEPFTNTVAALNAGRFAFTRVATAFAVLAMICVALVALSAGSADAGEPAAPVAEGALEAAARLRPRGLVRRAEPSLSEVEARALAARLTRGQVSAARAMLTDRGTLVAAVVEDRADGLARLYLIERGKDRTFRITDRVPLDVEGFRGAEWTEEVADLDGDGYSEIVCAGQNPADYERDGRRFVVFAPRKWQVYSLHVAPEAGAASRLRATWSPNSMDDDARRFRRAMRLRAQAP
ncbi:MAG TPA: serine/threonine-protein kinase [Pyrinomonadaceae bacterium]|nr:serine/threonine-protein kinase [Pyrinomonadaceae bacterium]